MNSKQLVILIILVSLVINIFCLSLMDISIYGWYLMVYDFIIVVTIKTVLEFSKYYKDCLRDEILQKLEFEGNNTTMGYCMHCKTFTNQYMTYDGLFYDVYNKNTNMYMKCYECENNVSEYITKDKI